MFDFTLYKIIQLEFQLKISPISVVVSDQLIYGFDDYLHMYLYIMSILHFYFMSVFFLSLTSQGDPINV